MAQRLLSRPFTKNPFSEISTYSRKNLTLSATTRKDIPPAEPPKPKLTHTNPSIPTGSLRETLKDLKGPTRWIVIGSFLVLATAESTFWIKVIHANFFAKEDDDEADEFLQRCKEALRGFRRAWLPNYQSWFGASIWGL
jgi:hypothetical protein